MISYKSAEVNMTTRGSGKEEEEEPEDDGFEETAGEN